MSDDLEAVVDLLHAATTSHSRFKVLSLAYRQLTISIVEARDELGKDRKTADGQVSALLAGGLLESVGTDRYRITDDGRKACELVVAGVAGSAALGPLVGRRLLGVQYGREASPQQVRRRLRKHATGIVAADGDVDVLAVLPDDPSLVADLRFAIERERAATTFAARVAALIEN